MLQNNPPNAGSFRYKTGTTVAVSGLPVGVKKTDIQGAFGDFGQILRIDLETGRAFVEFDDERDAKDALAEMDGKKLKDCRIRVERSNAKAVSTNTPRHGAKGVHTVDRKFQPVLDTDIQSGRSAAAAPSREGGRRVEVRREGSLDAPRRCSEPRKRSRDKRSGSGRRAGRSRDKRSRSRDKRDKRSRSRDRRQR